MLQKTKMENLCYLRAIQGHSGSIPIEPESMGYVKDSSKLSEIHLPQRTFIEPSSPYWDNGIILGGKDKDRARQAVFLTPTNHFGDDPDEEEPHDDFTVQHQAAYATKWKYDQNAVYWIRLSKAQNQGLEFWQTSHLQSSPTLRHFEIVLMA